MVVLYKNLRKRVLGVFCNCREPDGIPGKVSVARDSDAH